MAALEPLIETSQLHSERFRLLLADKNTVPDISYDPETDTVRLLLVPRQTPTFVHFIDGDLALICDVHSLDIVGLHIEAFQSRFVPKHSNVELVWQLHEPRPVYNFGEVLNAAERKKPVVVTEVVRATQADLKQNRVAVTLVPA
jgi:hypothetical protein